MILGCGFLFSLCSLAATYGGEFGVSFAFMLLALVCSFASLRNFDERV